MSEAEERGLLEDCFDGMLRSTLSAVFRLRLCLGQMVQDFPSDLHLRHDALHGTREFKKDKEQPCDLPFLLAFSTMRVSTYFASAEVFFGRRSL